MKRLLPFILLSLIYLSAYSQNIDINSSNIVCMQKPLNTKKEIKFTKNKDCVHSIELSVDAKLKDISSLYSATSKPLTTSKRYVRWFNFIAPSSGHVSIIINADLGEFLNIYSGSCNNLTEIYAVQNGHQWEVKSLIPGDRYYLRFDVPIHNVKLEETIMIKSILNLAPEIENCIRAQKVSVGDICTSGNNKYVSFSGPRPSCVPYADANVWYSIKAPLSGKLKLNSGADFYHVLAVYGGRCDKLEEIFCSKNPEKCSGYLEVKNLKPGRQYFVQIASAQGPFGLDFGNYCLEILDGSSEEVYVPLKLDAGITCKGEGFGQINYTINGGKGAYTIEGNTVGEVLITGQQYGITVKDEWGCEVSYYDRVECGTYDCQLTAEVATENITCHGEANGTASVTVKNENGNINYQWSDGQTTKIATGLKAGTYEVTITDNKNCELIKTLTINEPKALKLGINSINYNINKNDGLSISASGGNPPYKFVWEKDGEQISESKDINFTTPGRYAIKVTDENACEAQIRDIEIIDPKKVNNINIMQWVVYPLPADKEFHIKLNIPNNETASFSLIDSRGLSLKTIEVGINSQDIIFPTLDIPSGIYLLQFKTGKHIDQRKVIIQR